MRTPENGQVVNFKLDRECALQLKELLECHRWWTVSGLVREAIRRMHRQEDTIKGTAVPVKATPKRKGVRS